MSRHVVRVTTSLACSSSPHTGSVSRSKRSGSRRHTSTKRIGSGRPFRRRGGNSVNWTSASSPTASWRSSLIRNCPAAPAAATRAARLTVAPDIVAFAVKDGAVVSTDMQRRKFRLCIDETLHRKAAHGAAEPAQHISSCLITHCCGQRGKASQIDKQHSRDRGFRWLHKRLASGTFHTFVGYPEGFAPGSPPCRTPT